MQNAEQAIRLILLLIAFMCGLTGALLAPRDRPDLAALCTASATTALAFLVRDITPRNRN